MSEICVRVAHRLPGFDLDVAWRSPGGFTVLFGYSGAGKSLTLSALTGVFRPDEGRVSLGEIVFFDSVAGVFVPPQKRRIGYVPQGGELFPHMTVARNIGYALKGHTSAERSERVAEMLAALKIEHLRDRLPGTLSGGERQRAALARALAPKPRALVLDEPFSALDLPVRVEMRELLRTVQRELDIPVAMVTHDLYEACALADTLVVYSGTGTVQVGSPRELLADPGTPEIRRLLRAVDMPPQVFARN